MDEFDNLSDEPPELKYYPVEADKNDFQNRILDDKHNPYATPLKSEEKKEQLAAVQEEEQAVPVKEEPKTTKAGGKKNKKGKGKKGAQSAPEILKSHAPAKEVAQVVLVKDETELSKKNKKSERVEPVAKQTVVAEPTSPAPPPKPLVPSLTFYPFAYALLDDECHRHCWMCLRESLPYDHTFTLLKCSGCNAARFCNATCQKRGWLDHRAECHAIQRVGGIPDVEARLLGRIMYRHKMITEGKDKDETFYIHRTSARHVMQLTAHTKEIKQDTAAMAKWEALYARLHNFYEPRHMMEKETIFELHCRNYINRHAISDVDYSREIGKGLYLDLCAYNHSCRPNAVFSCAGLVATMRPLSDGVDLENRSTTHYTYIDLLTAKQPRHKLLKDTWYFDCACVRCTDSSEEVLTALRCPDCTHSVVLFGDECAKDELTMATVCAECRRELPRGEITDALSFMKHIDDTIDAVDLTREKLDEVLKKAERVLAEENVYLTRVYQVAIGFTAKDDVKKLLSLHLKALPALKICFPPNHPTLAQHHDTIGRLYAKQKEIVHAEEHFKRSVAMFTTSLGEEHPKTVAVVENMKLALGGEVKTDNIIFKS